MCEEGDSGGRLSALARRFRGFLPVVIDLETGGFNSATHALLELGASIIDMDSDGRVVAGDIIFHHVQPFAGAALDPAALAFTGIDPWHPFRFAIDEREALTDLFRAIRRSLREPRAWPLTPLRVVVVQAATERMLVIRSASEIHRRDAQHKRRLARRMPRRVSLPAAPRLRSPRSQRATRTPGPKKRPVMRAR